MFTVYCIRDYVNKKIIAQCSGLDAAMLRADEEYDLGSQNIAVYDADGVVVYEPEKELLFDEA